MSTTGSRTIKASRELQGKVGTGQIDPAKIEKAQQVIADNTVDFFPVAKQYLDELQYCIKKARSGKAENENILESMRSNIMNIKANAGTFNYGVVSAITANMLTFLEGLDELDKKVVDIVDLLHKTILLILVRKLSGDGGSEGKALLAAFDEVCRKYQQKLAEH